MAGLFVTILFVLIPVDVRAGCNHPWVESTDRSYSLKDLTVLVPERTLVDLRSRGSGTTPTSIPVRWGRVLPIT